MSTGMLNDAVAYKERLAQVKARIKELAKDGKAMPGSTSRQPDRALRGF